MHLPDKTTLLAILSIATGFSIENVNHYLQALALLVGIVASIVSIFRNTKK